MEHRLSNRTVCQRTVLIESPLSGPASAMARDVSPGGIFVEISGLHFRLNAPVWVTLNLPNSQCSEDFRIAAMVVRCDREGIALMFLDRPRDLIADFGPSVQPGTASRDGSFASRVTPRLAG